MADTTTAPQTATEEEAAKLKRAQEKASGQPLTAHHDSAS